MKRDDFPHVVISAVARTPVGLKCGTLSNFSAEDLGVLASEEAIRRSGVPRERIDASVGANVYQFTAPGAQDIYFPRNIALRCHLNIETPGLLVQRICGSGFQTVISAFQHIAMPDAVDDTGIVLKALVAKSLEPSLDRAAMEAARKTTFHPALQRDKPVGVWVAYPVRFMLKDQ